MKIVLHKIAQTKDLLTSNSGLVCVAKMMEDFGFSDAVDAAFPVPKSNRGYKPSVFVNSLVLMLLEGGQCLDDMQHIRQDNALCTMLGLKRVPESDTIGDWLRRMGKAGVQSIVAVNRKILKKTLHNIQGVTLDIDATFCASQNKSAQWSYKKSKGYMPMVGNIAETGQIVATEFRDGNESPASGNFEFIQACEAALPEGVHLKALRSDAAGYQAAILDMCCERNIKFAIRAKMSKGLKSQILSQSEDQWQPLFDRHGAPVEGLSTLRLEHAMKNSQSEFTIIVQRQLLNGQLNLDLDILDEPEMISNGRYLYRAIAVSPKHNNTDSQWVNWYNQRGEHSENRIKELKSDFAAGRLPCRDFEANALYFSLCALTYNIFVLFRSVLPARFEAARAKTIRLRMWGLAGKVAHHGRRCILKMAQAHCDLLHDVMQRLEFVQWNT